jgi:hypothetical protein
MTGLCEREGDGRGAEEDEAKERNGLLVVTRDAAAQHGDDHRRHDEPQWYQDHREQLWRRDGQERREHDQSDAQDREGFACARLHGALPS